MVRTITLILEALPPKQPNPPLFLLSGREMFTIRRYGGKLFSKHWIGILKIHFIWLQEIWSIPVFTEMTGMNYGLILGLPFHKSHLWLCQAIMIAKTAL